MNRTKSHRSRWAGLAGPLAVAGLALGVVGPSIGLLDKYDSNGVPANLLATRETYSTEFLQAIAAKLPEQSRVPKASPELLDDKTERNLHFVEDCEVRVSFVHEGAGYRNTAGFFEFKSDKPPTDPKDAKRIAVFPNASFSGSGGGLRTGDTVMIGKFSKGDAIGFCCISDGFRNGSVTEGIATMWSIDDLNPESSASQRGHTVLLRDPDKGRFVIAFEDMLRDGSGCDEDFNDLILSVQVNPPEAVVTTDVAVLEGAKDTDGDGVIDALDHWPEDDERAFLVEYPAAGAVGTIAFEDMWPKQGDYDFNDLVMSWHVAQARNAKGEVKDVVSTFGVLACGATKRFGTHLRLPVKRSNVASATIRVDGGSEETLSGDAALAEAVFQIAANVREAIDFGTGEEFANTIEGSAEQKGRVVTTTVTFATPVSASSLGAAPYDVFLRDGNAEVHLPGMPGTERMTRDLWGTAADASDPAGGVTFVTKTGLPWAIVTSVPWKHPVEGTPISDAYPDFTRWAESSGASKTDWASRPADGTIWVAR